MNSQRFLKLRPYTQVDKLDCLALFDSNTPSYFAPLEKPAFSAFLDRQGIQYFIVTDASDVAFACGGLKIDQVNHTAKLRWDMVRQDLHHQGFGSFLTYGRLFLLVDDPTIRTVRLGTSQFVYEFYEKIGLKVYQVTPNGIAPGFDEYLMQAEFNQEFRNFIKRNWLK